VKILLAGATGAVGRPLVPLLVAAGHEVLGLTRRRERVADVETAGARGAVCDVMDRDTLLRVAEEFGPDVVMDQTTDLPQRYDARRMDRFYAGMGPLRSIGSPNLLEAAARTGARPVFQSIAFIYAPGEDGRPRTEDDRVLGEDAPPPWNLALPVITALERRVAGEGGTVLRYGFFYGPGTHLAPGGQIHADVGRRRFPVVGGGRGVFSFIHVEDAAAAAVSVVARPEVRGILNVVDDEPMTLREWLPLYAAAIGAPRPLPVPAWLARPLSGPLPVHMATRVPPVSNARARQALGWEPGRASVRDGFAEAQPSPSSVA
jgi:2-alkyl-3-oxoalkanoate reductase